MFALVGQQIALRPYLVLLPLLPLFLAIPFVGPALNPNLYGDEPGYLRLAGNLVHGHYLTGRNDEISGGPHIPNLWFGPGLPLVLAPFVALHLPVSLIRLLGPVFLFLAVLVFFRLLRLYVSPRVSVVGALAFGLYLPFYTLLEHLHSETLALLLIVTMLYGLARYLRAGGLKHLVVAGGALGWLALTRIAFGWIVTILLVLTVLWWVIRRGDWPRRFAAVCCLALALCVPWLAYTYSVTGRPFYWGSSGASALYWMASPYPGERGDWQPPGAVFANSKFAPHRQFFKSLIGRPLIKQDDALIRAALKNIRARPANYAKHVLANVSRMWFDFPHSFLDERLTPLLFIVSNGVVLTALFVCFALLVGRWRSLLPVEAIPFGLFAVTAFTFHALLAADTRMWMPVIPVVIWLVVLVISRRIRIVPGTSSD